jgi:hypothetical protein
MSPHAESGFVNVSFLHPQRGLLSVLTKKQLKQGLAGWMPGGSLQPPPKYHQTTIEKANIASRFFSPTHFFSQLAQFYPYYTTSLKRFLLLSSPSLPTDDRAFGHFADCEQGAHMVHLPVGVSVCPRATKRRLRCERQLTDHPSLSLISLLVSSSILY